MNKKCYILCVFLCLATSLFAQRQIKSPFTRYGYGDLYSFSSAYSHAMGGIGVGVQNPVQINFLNPAQQSAIKKESFLFNVGLGGNFRNLRENGTSTNLSTAGLETLSLAFPIVENRWGCAVGVLPFNSVGYEMNYKDSLASYSYKGDGGINQVVFSTGLRVFKGLSLGVNAMYLFGTTNYLGENYFEEASAFYSRKEIEYKTLGFLWNAGAQYNWALSEEKSLTFGITFKSSQSLTYRESDYFGSYITGGLTEIQKDTVAQKTNKSTTDLPMELNFGVSFNSLNTLMVGFDFGYQDWTNVSCYGKENPNLEKTTYLKLGGEWIPDYKSTKFYKRIPIRLGVHYADLPIVLDQDGENAQLKDFGFTVGTRIKSKQTQNTLAIAVDFGQRGNTSLAKSLQERYLLLKLNVTLQEVWFTKRKIN